MNRLSLVVALVAFAGGALAQPADAPKTVPATPLTIGGQPAKTGKPAANPNLYDETADAKTLINAALAKAKKENRRVLVQWGFNKCFWCQLMHREFKTQKLSRKLMYEYDVVYIEAAKNKANFETAVGYGADLKQHGYPYLTVLDSSGKAIANQETGSLEVKGEDGKSLTGDAAAHDEAKLMSFLTEHQAGYLQADAVLKDGLDQAKASGKKVFLHVGAPWCGWCHRLEDWLALEEISPVFGKDYVDVKLDQDRMVGAKEAAARYGMPEKVGIPWFAIIDPESGKVMADSMVGKQTIGCPANDEEIGHFMGMLERTHKNLTAPDMTKIKKSLGEKAETYKAH